MWSAPSKSQPTKLLPDECGALITISGMILFIIYRVKSRSDFQEVFAGRCSWCLVH
jgi:hypothetical protein